MSTLIVVGYDDMTKAQQMRHDMVMLEKEYLVDMEDAVVVVRDLKGKVKLHQGCKFARSRRHGRRILGHIDRLLIFQPDFRYGSGSRYRCNEWRSGRCRHQ